MNNCPLLIIGAALMFTSCANKGNDEAAIKKVLETESSSWREADAAAHAACWKIQPYSRILVSTGDGRVIDVPPAYMANAPDNKLGNGGTSFNTNYKMDISDDRAWVSHDETSLSATGDTTFSSEIRMLEKINGEWKIVGQSIHIKGK